MGNERIYLSRPPRAPALAGLVSGLEYVRDPPATTRERMVPGGNTSLVIMLDADRFGYLDDGEHWADGACLVGPAQRAHVVSTAPQAGMVGLTFTPGGAAPFLRCPVSATTDGYLPLTELWGADGRRGVERVRRAGSPEAVLRAVEQLLLSQLSDSPGRDGSVAAAAAALDRGARVGDVVSEFGTTAKPFVRRFTAAVGLTPKRYARVRRLQHLLAGVPVGGPVDWAAAAAQHGFYDQSHLIHDFTEITGVRPTTYRPRGPGEFNHLPC